ncbi:MAG TPA: V-type ATPase 116kDa subunit family protein [Acholeplasma sp.]|nr:V-type ATPase 116kDa subunit family protein [Acholeplasma sp.]
MIAKMKLVNLSTDKEKLDELLARFIDFPGFHPVDVSKIVSTVHGATAFEGENPTVELIEQIKEIESDLVLSLLPVKTRELKDSMDDMHQYLVDSHAAFSAEFKRIKQLEAENEKIHEALKQIENLEALELSFDDLFNAKFISLRFGKLPFDSVERINYYYQKPFIFIPFNEDKEKRSLWCMYVTSNEYEREIDNLFTSMYFERIYIPEFVHGTPELAKETLKQTIIDNEKKMDALREELRILALQYQEKLGVIKGELEFLYLMYEARKHVVGLGDRISISGFIEEKRVQQFRTYFEGIETLEIDVDDADSDGRFQPPTKLKNNWFSKPFQVFVEMYGTPTYGDVDPTNFLAISYSLIFGIMFGDVGQGLLLAFIGFLLGKFKKWSLGPIVMRMGIFGAFFGLVYGEIFGNEEILHHFYHELGISFLPFVPMSPSNTMTLLLATVGLGSAFLLISMVINTMFKFKHKEYALAICSPNGISGILFYGFVLIGIVLEMGLGISGVFNFITIPILILIPIILIFLKEPLERKFHHEKMFPDGFGGFFMEGFFELFEVILSYVTNTLSFLRVGGFVLSHAGLMLVVKSLADGGSNMVVMAIGNLFVMGLEGLLVGIQVLRLEFYELFSRYYDGSGIIFSPTLQEER